MKITPVGAGRDPKTDEDAEELDDEAAGRQAAARAAMPPPQALGASSAMQLQLYAALRSYSQLTPSEKMKSLRYAGLGLGKAEEHALAPQVRKQIMNFALKTRNFVF